MAFPTYPTDSAFSSSGDRPGLTKREYFASLIMAQLALTADTAVGKAMDAVAMADALIRQLNK